MIKSNETKLNIQLKDIESRIMDLTTPEILKYKSSHPSLFEDIGRFSTYSKINEYRPIINELSVLQKENYGNEGITPLLIDITQKYLDILEAKNSVAFSLVSFNHIIAACLMFYIKNIKCKKGKKGRNFQEFLNTHRGVLTNGILGVAETMVEYIRNVGWYCDFDNQIFKFIYDTPLYNKMMNILFENNHFTDIEHQFPNYNHEIGWQEVIKSLDWIDEDSKSWCKYSKKYEQE